MVKDASIWEAVKRRKEMGNLPSGFSAFQSVACNAWNIYFKGNEESHPSMIQNGLTEKKAKAKAQLLNSVLYTK